VPTAPPLLIGRNSGPDVISPHRQPRVEQCFHPGLIRDGAEAVADAAQIGKHSRLEPAGVTLLALRQTEILEHHQIAAKLVDLIEDHVPAIARSGHPELKGTIRYSDRPVLTIGKTVKPDETLISRVRG
jgi:hypothetical protein